MAEGKHRPHPNLKVAAVAAAAAVALAVAAVNRLHKELAQANKVTTC